uniref:Uncharacterized protein n=1 Tax=Brassica oleracea TaxID=3712 RepID=A0A3P6FDH3_BRAOL|nr:unnamed protein product [Brassica oleracea]
MPIIGHLHLLLSSLIHKSFQKISSNYVANEIFKSHDVNISSRGLPPIDESLFFRFFRFLLRSTWRLLEVHEEAHRRQASWTASNRAVKNHPCGGVREVLL